MSDALRAAVAEIRGRVASEAPELKPCPFCGEIKKIYRYPLHRLATHRSHPLVRCHNCSARINGDEDDFSSGAETATAAWNTRANLPSTLTAAQELPKIKALVETLREISRKVRWEINPSNYTHDDVCNINQDWCDVGDMADAAIEKWEKKDE